MITPIHKPIKSAKQQNTDVNNQQQNGKDEERELHTVTVDVSQ